jgi:hypothetical protein
MLECWEKRKDRKNGIVEIRMKLEQWNTGILGEKGRTGTKSGFYFLLLSFGYPSFHHSIIPVFYSSSIPVSSRKVRVEKRVTEDMNS